MFTLSCESFRVCYDMAEKILAEEMPIGSAEYVIAQTHFSRTDEISGLENLGFTFHDRCLRMEISPNQARERTADKCQTEGAVICETEDVTEGMLELAYEVFDSDRRFFLNKAFGPAEEAREVIRAYLDHYRKKPCRIIKAAHEEEVLGFVMLCETSTGSYENVLGLTKRNLMGKATAFPLYSKALSIAGCERRRYIGVASSANAASINLHMQLGAKVTEIIDRYILRNGRAIC